MSLQFGFVFFFGRMKLAQKLPVKCWWDSNVRIFIPKFKIVLRYFYIFFKEYLLRQEDKHDFCTEISFSESAQISFFISNSWCDFKAVLKENLIKYIFVDISSLFCAHATNAGLVELMKSIFWFFNHFNFAALLVPYDFFSTFWNKFFSLQTPILNSFYF